jgi:hypothetical protein
MRLTLLLVTTLALAGCGRAAGLPARAPEPVTVAAAAAKPTDAQVEAFVKTWFALLDRNAPVAKYLPLIDDKGLEMAFPERTLRSHADFTDWYAGILRTIKVAKHTLELVEVKALDAKRFEVHVIVLWEATPVDGAPIRFRADQTWQVHAAAGGLKISRYVVGAAADQP